MKGKTLWHKAEIRDTDIKLAIFADNFRELDQKLHTAKNALYQDLKEIRLLEY